MPVQYAASADSGSFITFLNKPEVAKLWRDAEEANFKEKGKEVVFADPSPLSLLTLDGDLRSVFHYAITPAGKSLKVLLDIAKTNPEGT
jgi:hypothetical protein